VLLIEDIGIYRNVAYTKNKRNRIRNSN